VFAKGAKPGIVFSDWIRTERTERTERSEEREDWNERTALRQLKTGEIDLM